MRWMGGRGGGGIEDRRGMGGGTLAGGGIGAIAIALIGYFIFGIDPFTTEQIVSQIGGAGTQEEGKRGTPEDQAGRFVDVVATNVNDVWSAKLEGYEPPRVVLYEQGTRTGCGFGQSAMGPFYCPNDETVYLDLGFWQEMETRLGASGADFARAYVIAHEFGHHVQALTGTMNKVEQAQGRARSVAEANRYSVALELQADCYAGVWAKNAAAVSNGQVALEAGDLEEGLKTANAIGDDTLQKKSAGQVTPERFTHGTSAQRVEWLKKGYDSGNPNRCDTFAGL
ncbi:MAG: neutral zinc metallopeptidase [Alphaproteobacteria bacterium]